MIRFIWRGWAAGTLRCNYFAEHVAPNPHGYRGCISCGPIAVDWWGKKL